MSSGAARDFKNRQTEVPGDGNTKPLPVDRDGNAYATDLYYDDAAGARQSLRATIAGGGGASVIAGTNIGVTGGPAYTVSVVNAPTFSGTVTAAGLTTAGTLSAGGNTYPVGAASTGQILQATAPGVFSLAAQVSLTAGTNMNIGVGPAYTISTVNNPVFGSVVTSGGFTTAGTTDTTTLTASGNTYPLTAASAGVFIQGTGANTYGNSSYTLPTSIGAAGTFLRSDGTNLLTSSYTVPSTVSTSGKIAQSDGTNLVMSGMTWPTASVGYQAPLIQSSLGVVGFAPYGFPAASPTAANQYIRSTASGTANAAWADSPGGPVSVHPLAFSSVSGNNVAGVYKSSIDTPGIPSVGNFNGSVAGQNANLNVRYALKGYYGTWTLKIDGVLTNFLTDTNAYYAVILNSTDAITVTPQASGTQVVKWGSGGTAVVTNTYNIAPNGSAANSSSGAIQSWSLSMTGDDTLTFEYKNTNAASSTKVALFGFILYQ